MILSVALSPCVDRTVVVDRLTVGAVHRPAVVTVTPGGKGFNVARAARLLGATVTTAGIVGGHSGRWLREALAAAGVATMLIDGANETRTSVSVADLSTHVMTDLYEPATAVSAAEWAALEHAVAAQLTPGTWLSVSGTHPPGAPADAVTRLVRIAHERGAFAAVDTHGPALLDALNARPDLIKVNTDEARTALGSSSAATPHDLAVDLSAAAGTPAIVTAGADGSYSTEWHARCDGVFGAYPVGSGDSFLAGLLSRFDGPDWHPQIPSAMRAAVGAATANALQPGAANFDPAVAATLTATAFVERVASLA